jgi:hypothetical protein
MKLFGRKKDAAPQAPEIEIADPSQGLTRLMLELTGKVEDEFNKFVAEHLERIHTPGGYELEKKEADFIDLGMDKEYLRALDGVELSVVDSIALPQVLGRKKGKCEVVIRWRVRGVHARPLAGIPPSGNEITIDGVTVTSLRDYRIRVDYTFWEFPELTRKALEQ